MMTRECEEEIQGVSDRLPPSIANTKRTVEQILAQIPPIDINYSSIVIAERNEAHHLSASIISSIDIFRLYWSNDVIEQIAQNTNINVEIQCQQIFSRQHERKFDAANNSSSESKDAESHKRPWFST